MQTEFIRLPPDSTGKRVRHLVNTDIVISTLYSIPAIKATVKGSISGATGTFTGIVTDNSQDYINMYLTDTIGSFVANENLTDEAGFVIYARTKTVYPDVYTPNISVSDADNLSQTLKIDSRGAALTTFPEGTPQFDAFGRMQVSQMQAVGEYSHVGEDLSGKYWTHTVGAGTVTYDVNTSSILYSVGTTLGDEARRTTNQYHPYKPGTSQLIYMTVSCSDNGKDNVVREWGYFDDNNGVGFRLNGIFLEVFIRTDSSGVVTERVVTQSDWNTNTLLTANNVGEFVLDKSKGNIYWIDFSWLGMGRVRFGIETPDGRRITCHTIENANQLQSSFMRVPTLPLTWRIRNIGNTSTASTMRVTCAAVMTESADLLYHGKLLHVSPPAPVTLSNSDTYVPFLSFKAKSLVNGKPNTIVGIHETFDWASSGDANIHIAIFVLPSENYLTGFNWSDTIVPGTMLWVDQSATAIRFDLLPNLKPIESFIAPANGAMRTALGDRMEKSFGLGGNLNVPEDEKGVFVFAAKVLKPNTTVDLFYTKFWKEIR